MFCRGVFFRGSSLNWCLSDPLDRFGSSFVNNDQRFVEQLMVIARALPDGPVPPKTLIVDFDVDFRFRFRFQFQ
eukprot:379993-Heterocapsa_arctica.AAC.1